MTLRRFKTELETIPHKRGRRTFGNVIEFDNGMRAYIGFRKIGHAFRGKESSIAKAAKAEVAAWTFDIHTISFARFHKADVIGVFVQETGDIYLIKMTAITRPELGLMDKTCSLSSGYRRVLFQNFKVKRARIKL